MAPLLLFGTSTSLKSILNVPQYDKSQKGNPLRLKYMPGTPPIACTTGSPGVVGQPGVQKMPVTASTALVPLLCILTGSQKGSHVSSTG